MALKIYPSETPDPLAERRSRVQAGLSGSPSPVETPVLEPAKMAPSLKVTAATLPSMRQVNPRDALQLYGVLIDQHAIVGKRIREIVSRPADSRQSTLQVIGSQLFKMMETVKEMGPE